MDDFQDLAKNNPVEALIALHKRLAALEAELMPAPAEPAPAQ